MKGNLTRNNVFYYLKSDEYQKALTWITANIERYDQFSPELLAQHIHSLP